MGISIIQSNPNISGVLYDISPMLCAIETSIHEYSLENKAVAMTGNFLVDDIGTGYDLILAIGIWGYAKDGLDVLMQKLYYSLNDGGVLLCLSDGILNDYSYPSDAILNWLPYSLQGIHMEIEKNYISDAALRNGFKSIEKTTLFMSLGTVDLDIIRK